MPSVPPPLDESAVEALLAGRTSAAATGDMGLVAFVEDLRTAVDGPVPEPTPQLAAFMARGLSTEKGELPAPAVTNVPGPAVPQAAGLPKWRKRKMTVSGLLAALGAKLAGMGLAAKAALGLGVAAMSTTAAAAAGVLPDPAQHAVASVVNAVSPFDVPDGESTGGVAADEGDGEGDGETSTTTSSSTTVPGGDDDGTDGGETGVVANHGACVSEAARTAPRGPGGQHGKAVSEVAKSDCGKTGGDDGGDDDGTTTTSSPTTTIDGDDEELTSGISNRGKDNGNGGNNGNNGNRGSGGGNSGPGGGNGGNSGPGKGNGR